MTLENTLNRGVRTRTNLDGFNFFMAADVLVYFGDLSALLERFAELSTPGAGLVLSCERAVEGEALLLGWRLLPLGLFLDAGEHVLVDASRVGYEPAMHREIVLRVERGRDVWGHLFAFVLNNRKGRDKH